ncbi:hypothetical protein ACSTHG_23795, partial [Vibrio parahaemolyticus]
MTGNPVGAFLELIAALIAERFPVDLAYLYGETNQQLTEREASPSRREVVTTTGGSPFEIPAPRSGWKIAKTIEQS